MIEILYKHSLLLYNINILVSKIDFADDIKNSSVFCRKFLSIFQIAPKCQAQKREEPKLYLGTYDSFNVM